MQLVNGCMRVWFAYSIPALVVFPWYSGFLLHPKIGNSFWFLIVCVQSLLGCLRFNYLCVHCGYYITAPRDSLWVDKTTLQKLIIIIIINKQINIALFTPEPISFNSYYYHQFVYQPICCSSTVSLSSTRAELHHDGTN